MSLPRVVIVDDHTLFREGVRSRIGNEVEIVGEAGTVDDALAVIHAERPDVVLLDVHMPDGGGLAVLAGVAPDLPGVRFLALSVSNAPADVIDLVHAGASGYVTKTIEPAELAGAVRRVAAGDAVFSPSLAGFVLDDPELARLTRVSARCFAWSRGVISTRRWRWSSGSLPRPWSTTCRRCFTSCSSRTATS